MKWKFLRIIVMVALLASFLAAAASGSRAFAAQNPAGTEEEDRLGFAIRLFRALAEANLDNAGSDEIELINMLLYEFKEEITRAGYSPAQLDKRLLAAVSGDIPAIGAPKSMDKMPRDHWAYAVVKRLHEAGVIDDISEISRERMKYAVAPEADGLAFVSRPEYNLIRPGGRMYRIDIRGGSANPETARYGAYDDNPVKLVSRDPVATFSLDVATASYSNARRFLNSGRLPDPDAVRVEELINYFPAASGDMKPNRLGDSPFRAAYELAPCPWNDNNVLLWLSVAAEDVDYETSPPANLVFLVDVSGSMDSPERLPLAQSALKMLTGKLRGEDKISIVTYAGTTQVVLESTSGSKKARILSAVDALGAGGSTAGGAGIKLAYEQARRGFIKGGVNRIILCTDGDFNVGVSDTDTLEAMVKREKESGVMLSVLGFGTDNYNDEMMTRITSSGNGNYSYIDSMSEARKVLDEEMSATLVTVAKDVKAQIEFNPAAVIEYRQIGYEKLQLDNEDFNDDTVDAGDIGAGKRVTVLYELTLAGSKPSADPLRYQPSPASSEDIAATDMKPGELAYLKFRWKTPDGNNGQLAEMPVMKRAMAESFAAAGDALRFSAAVAAYGQKLRGNANLTNTKWSEIASWAESANKGDPYRAEFVQLVKLAAALPITD